MEQKLKTEICMIHRGLIEEEREFLEKATRYTEYHVFFHGLITGMVSLLPDTLFGFFLFPCVS